MSDDEEDFNFGSAAHDDSRFLITTPLSNLNHIRRVINKFGRFLLVGKKVSSSKNLFNYEP